MQSEPYTESTELKFKRCKHSHVKLSNGELVCPECGNAWSGAGLHKLYQILTSIPEEHLQSHT